MTDISDNGLFVFPTHTAEWEHNKTQLLRANQHAPIAKCTAVTGDVHYKVFSDKVGLLQTLYLCNGAKMMLTGNNNVKHGLFNGSVGVVIDILYSYVRNPTNIARGCNGRIQKIYRSPIRSLISTSEEENRLQVPWL